MGKIRQPIEEYITSLRNKGIEVEFCQGIKPQPQNGQTCKLVAGAVIQEYLHSQGHSLSSLPVHKQGLFDHSLRKRAKQTINSQVGEVYGPKQMQRIFNYNNFETDSYHIIDKDIYEAFLIKSLKQKQPIIVYFDVTPKVGDEDKQGMPNFFNGNFEHGAVIAGYYRIDTQLNLIAAQWDDFYDIPFNQLFNSTLQLSSSKSTEHYQKYYPIPGLFHHKKWIEKQQMDLMCDYLCDNQQSFKRDVFSFINNIWPKDKERIAAPPNTNSCLANILTIISGDFQKTELGEFSEYKLNFENESRYENENTIVRNSLFI